MSEILTERNYLVVGCGGLGCYIVEDLLRLAVKKITVCDPDVFDESNLNRQLYSSPKNIGKAKVLAAKERAEELGFKGEFLALKKAFEASMLDGADVVIDALDNIKTRLLLEELCAEKGLPLIHGAVEGCVYQVGVSMPKSGLLHRIYEGAIEPEKKYTNVFTVQACAAHQVALAAREAQEYFEMFEI